MPHSLRAKIKGLRYKGIITEKDCDRLCKALDNEDVLDKIRAEITNIPITDSDGHYNNWYREPQAIINDVLLIIDKSKADGESEGEG